MKRILTVCLGNICRSPLAEVILKAEAQKLGIAVHVESAGTAGYHVGAQADSRSIQVGRKHSVDISKHKAQKFIPAFFDQFDLILVMDKNNYRDVVAQATSAEQRTKVKMYRPDELDVDDPYWGKDADFETMYQVLQEHATSHLQ